MMMDINGTHRSSAASLGQQTVASRREARAIRAERSFRQIGGTIITLIIGIVLLDIWLGWAINDASRSLAIGRNEYTQGQKFNQELVVKRNELMSRESIEKKAAVLGLFRPGKKQIRRP